MIVFDILQCCRQRARCRSQLLLWLSSGTLFNTCPSSLPVSAQRSLDRPACSVTASPAPGLCSKCPQPAAAGSWHAARSPWAASPQPDRTLGISSSGQHTGSFLPAACAASGAAAQGSESRGWPQRSQLWLWLRSHWPGAGQHWGPFRGLGCSLCPSAELPPWPGHQLAVPRPGYCTSCLPGPFLLWGCGTLPGAANGGGCSSRGVRCRSASSISASAARLLCQHSALCLRGSIPAKPSWGSYAAPWPNQRECVPAAAGRPSKPILWGPAGSGPSPADWAPGPGSCCSWRLWLRAASACRWWLWLWAGSCLSGRLRGFLGGQCSQGIWPGGCHGCTWWLWAGRLWAEQPCGPPVWPGNLPYIRPACVHGCCMVALQLCCVLPCF